MYTEMDVIYAKSRNSLKLLIQHTLYISLDDKLWDWWLKSLLISDIAYMVAML